MAEQVSGRITLTVDELKDLLQSPRAQEGLSQTDLIAAVAEGAAKAHKPENPESPGISVYSYPEGELKHPKPRLKCDMFIGSAPLERSTLTPTEIEILNTMEPGHYTVRRADESTAVIEVRARRDSNQQIDRMWIVINAEDPDRNGFGTLTKLASQFVDANRVNAPKPREAMVV